MRVQADRAELRGVIDVATQAVRRGHIPVLECVHIVARDNRMRVIGTDMDIECQASCDAAVSKSGSATINAAALAAFVAGARGAHISLYVDGVALTVECDGASASLSLFAEDFPRMPKPDSGSEVFGVGDAIQFCSRFAADSSRPSLAGIHFERDFAVATNSRWVGSHTVKSDVASAMIPMTAAPIIARSLKSGGRLFVGDRTWRTEGDGVAAAGKLLEVGFPANWRDMFPSGALIATLDADDFKAAMREATLNFAEWAVCDISGGRMNITGEGFSAGGVTSAQSSITCDGDHDALFLMNVKQVVGLCDAFSGSVVDFTTDGRTITVRAHGDSSRACTMQGVNDARTNLPGGATT